MGKKKDFIASKPIVLENVPSKLSELITAIVTIEVNEANNANEVDFVKYLTTQEIEEQAEIGKVGFGRKYNANQQNLDEAIENALYSYVDGLYFVMINGEKQGKLEDKIQLTENDEVLFIKLTMLSGRMW